MDLANFLNPIGEDVASDDALSIMDIIAIRMQQGMVEQESEDEVVDVAIPTTMQAQEAIDLLL